MFRKRCAFLAMALTGLMSGNVVADLSNWSSQINDCNSNWDTMVDGIITMSSAYGNPPPTEDELAALMAENRCVCIYTKMDASTTHLDVADVRGDMTVFETWYASVLKRGINYKPSDTERTMVITVMTYGEPILMSRIAAQMECASEYQKQ